SRAGVARDRVQGRADRQRSLPSGVLPRPRRKRARDPPSLRAQGPEAGRLARFNRARRRGLQGAYAPVEPKPLPPRTVLSSESDSSGLASAIGTRISWAT